MHVSLKDTVLASILGGLAGGALMGVLLGVMGTLTDYAQLIGSSSAFSGFALQLLISAILGLVFGLVLGKVITSLVYGAVVGGLYGVIWWVLGPLLIQPTILGMSPQLSLSDLNGNLPELAGYLIYGVVLGVIFAGVVKSESPPVTESPSQV